MHAMGRGVETDEVMAYMGYSLAAQLGDADAAQQRDRIAKRLTRAQLDQVQQLIEARRGTTDR